MKDTTTMPVTIITGFLGAGKTTLLNEILHRNRDKNFLIIENEAGNINIDRELVKNSTKNTLFELTGGCICCSLSTELGTVLNSIILSSVIYDHVLIEATGMADAGQVINMFSGARIQRFFHLDSVIGLVDATTFMKRLPNFEEVRGQISKSNIILINKCDLIQQGELELVEHQLQTINPLARIEKVTHGKFMDTEILNSRCFDPVNLEKEIVDFTKLTFTQIPANNIHQIQTLSYTLNGEFDVEKISLWFDQFLKMNGDNVLRIKAILSIHDMNHKLILQSVGNDFHTSLGETWDNSDKRESKIVIIGSNMDETPIRNELLTLLV
ncbi:GTP-binding protein [Halosquirtibacter xylanolyticus]|uniref:CobW family GTP-binding protein n=1 Tax=Halosquirtibacter xylanolyticus TaxID=3374599 RepID=UPI00374A3B44|nr:GTP-binding protein [Prolixibacteraceae bacterium]